jgi:hypothetical protein
MRSALAFALVLAASARAANPPTFTAAELRADLVEINRAVHEMPADLAHSADVPQLEHAIRDMDAGLANSPPLDRDAAWRLFATLNPVLADGHLFVGFVDWRGEIRAHLAAGGALFPFEMRVTPGCELRVRAELGGRISPYSDTVIRSVNGMPAAAICEQLLARAHGDTRAFRADLVSRRFWLYFLKVFGAPTDFVIGFAGQDAIHVAGSVQLPQLLADESSFERQFRLQFIGDASAAILTLGTFAWPDKPQVLDFARDAFAKLHAARTGTLIVDLRNNGGGDDDVWIEGVMPYIASKPFRTGSTYRKRVVVADPAKGEVPGTVVNGRIETWFPPARDISRQFKGKIYVATSTGTYSSALVFCNVMQDFGFGTVAGPGGSARANVSGGARRTTLTHTGLIVVAPRFVVDRPSGARTPELFTPDIDLTESEPLSGLIGRGVLSETVVTSRH